MRGGVSWALITMAVVGCLGGMADASEPSAAPIPSAAAVSSSQPSPPRTPEPTGRAPLQTSTPTNRAPTLPPTRPTPIVPIPTRQPSPTPIEEPQGGECVDEAYNLNGIEWNRTLSWRFNPQSVPGDLDAAQVLEVVKQAFDNVTEARNLCGRPDNINARARYIGPTVHPACPDVDERWHQYGVVGFGQMPDGWDDALAMMCPWVFDDGTIYATDILINIDVSWTLDHAQCRGTQHILEAVLTHEVAHAFGLDHVRQRRHGDLTMRPISDYCDYGDATLGLGDILGLEALYGSPVGD